MSEQTSDTRDPRLLSSPRDGPGRWFQSGLQRALLAVIGLTVAVAAFFFLAVALVAATAIALVVGARVWWVMRRVRAKAAASAPLEGEYSVVENPQIERVTREG